MYGNAIINCLNRHCEIQLKMALMKTTGGLKNPCRVQTAKDKGQT